MSAPDRRSRHDECGLRGERGSSTGLRPESRRREGDPHDLIRLADWFAHRRAVEVRRIRRTGVVLARGRGPTLCGERLPSPWWDEVTVNRSGGTTIESGGPSGGRDAARNVARPARRHRRLHSRRQPTGHRTELRTVVRADRCGAVAAGGCPSARRVMRVVRFGARWLGERCRRRTAAMRGSFVVVACGARRPKHERCPHSGSSRPCRHWTTTGVYPTWRHDESRAKAPSSVVVRQRCTSSAASPRRVASAASQPVAAAWAAG